MCVCWGETEGGGVGVAGNYNVLDLEEEGGSLERGAAQ